MEGGPGKDGALDAAGQVLDAAEEGELEPGAGTPLLGKLTLFSGVRDLPSRVKCAVLPWATLHAALKGEAEASTE